MVDPTVKSMLKELLQKNKMRRSTIINPFPVKEIESLQNAVISR